MRRKQIGWMGGTFDPVHNVHLILAEKAREQLNFDEVWWIPARQSPHKAVPPLASGDERAAMIALAIAGLPGHRLMDVERSREGPSYTIETVNELCALYPEVDFHLIMGADQVHALPRWHQIHALMNKVWFVRTARPGYDDPHLSERMDTWPESWQERLETVDMPQLDISSSEIRRRLAEGRSIVGWVPEPIRIRIEERGLYDRRTRTTD